jgi:hypothetical protein
MRTSAQLRGLPTEESLFGPSLATELRCGQQRGEEEQIASSLHVGSAWRASANRRQPSSTRRRTSHALLTALMTLRQVTDAERAAVDLAEAGDDCCDRRYPPLRIGNHSGGYRAQATRDHLLVWWSLSAAD